MYMACREFGNTRTTKDIAVASNLTKKNIAKNYRKLIQELDPVVPIADTANVFTELQITLI